jgi:hypothetical protein
MSHPLIRNGLPSRLLVCAVLLLTLLGAAPASAADPDPVPAATIIRGTVTLDPRVASALGAVLIQNQAQLRGAAFFAPTDLHAAHAGATSWLFVSVAGFRSQPAELSWRLEQAAWLGLVLVYPVAVGQWAAALQGSPEFAAELGRMPPDVLSPQARQDLTGTRPAGATSYYRFPWQSGTTMLYGSRGVHPSDFGMNGKAVDFLSDGNTGAGHAPNDLLAAASGSVSYVCRDALSVAIKIGDLLYAHLLDNGNLAIGHGFNQGESLGELRVGSFSANCGWAEQTAPWFHVHWGFPDTGSFEADGWTLQFDTQVWYRGAETVSVGQWMTASGGACGCSCSAAFVGGAGDGGRADHFAGLPLQWRAIPQPAPPAALVAFTEPAPAIPNITQAPVASAESPKPPAAAVTESSAAPARSAAMQPAAPPASASYRLARTVVAPGGGVKTSTGYRVRGTNGQLAELKSLSSAGYRLRPGFWGARACILGGLSARPTITLNRPALTLTWNAAPGARGYAIYRGTTPYFALTAAHAQTDKLEWTDANGSGDVAVNYTYVVTPANQCGGPTATYRVGEFDFGLTRGQ